MSNVSALLANCQVGSQNKIFTMYICSLIPYLIKDRQLVCCSRIGPGYIKDAYVPREPTLSTSSTNYISGRRNNYTRRKAIEQASRPYSNYDKPNCKVSPKTKTKKKRKEKN